MQRKSVQYDLFTRQPCECAIAPNVQDERPVIILTPTGIQCESFISSEQASSFILQAEILIRNLKTYREGLEDWQYDLFTGTELPEDLRRLGFKSPD